MQETVKPRVASRDQFNRQASHYNAQWNAWNQESLNWMLNSAPGSANSEGTRPCAKLLDVATGTGYTALGFAPIVASAIGLDVSTGMLAEARQRAETQGIRNVTFVEGSAENIPFEDESFDLVTCRIAAHHFLSVPEFMKGVARVLRPGGCFLLADSTIPENEPEIDAWQNHVEILRDPSHVRNYTVTEWRHFIESEGLQIEDITASGGTIFIRLQPWLEKAGCTVEQSALIREEFLNAPEAAKRAFQIKTLDDGEIQFGWQRILAKAVKSRE